MSRKIITALFAATLFATLLNPFGAAAAGGPVVVGTDDYGDWGGSGDGTAVGHALGQDLVKASIDLPNAERADFIMGVSFLPSPGGVPEASRYVWDVNLLDYDPATGKYAEEARFLELDGKFSNYSRGACDPTAGKCPPPRDPGMQPFAVRGNCVTSSTGTNLTTCEEIALVKATFDAAAKTITVPVPISLMKLGPCSAIMAGPNIFGGTISASPAAFVSSSLMPMDFLQVEGYVQLPSADGTPCPAIPEFEG